MQLVVFKAGLGAGLRLIGRCLVSLDQSYQKHGHYQELAAGRYDFAILLHIAAVVILLIGVHDHLQLTEGRLSGLHPSPKAPHQQLEAALLPDQDLDVDVGGIEDQRVDGGARGARDK